MTGSFADDWPYDILILSSTRFYTLPYLHAIKIYDNNFSCLFCVKSSILVLKKQMAKWWPTFLSFFWWLTISTAIWALVIGDTEPRSNNCSAPHLVNVVSLSLHNDRSTVGQQRQLSAVDIVMLTVTPA